MKALLIIFSSLLALLVAGLWIGSGSYPEQWKTEERINAQEASNKQRKDDIERIKSDLEDVATGDSAIEERARSELGMTKENESFFEIILRPENSSQPLSEDKIKGRDLDDPELISPEPKGLNLLPAAKATTDAPAEKSLTKDPVSKENTSKKAQPVDEIDEAENKKIDAEIKNSGG